MQYRDDRGHVACEEWGRGRYHRQEHDEYGSFAGNWDDDDGR
jgi:hypothetical protein